LISRIKKHLEYWKTAAIALPFVALLLLVSTHNLDEVIHSTIYCIVVISIGALSVIFWVWTMYNMIQLVGYLGNVDTKYNEVILELKDTKKLLKKEGNDARNRERRKS
jgi:hypothetical protein